MRGLAPRSHSLLGLPGWGTARAGGGGGQGTAGLAGQRPPRRSRSPTEPLLAGPGTRRGGRPRRSPERSPPFPRPQPRIPLWPADLPPNSEKVQLTWVRRLSCPSWWSGPVTAILGKWLRGASGTPTGGGVGGAPAGRRPLPPSHPPGDPALAAQAFAAQPSGGVCPGRGSGSLAPGLGAISASGLTSPLERQLRVMSVGEESALPRALGLGEPSSPQGPARLAAVLAGRRTFTYWGPGGLLKCCIKEQETAGSRNRQLPEAWSCQTHSSPCTWLLRPPPRCPAGRPPAPPVPGTGRRG